MSYLMDHSVSFFLNMMQHASFANFVQIAAMTFLVIWFHSRLVAE